MAETEGGKGGRARSKKIDELVEKMVRDGDAPEAPYVPPKKKAPYVPSEKEKQTRQYGTPISPPITRQYTDHMNKYA